MFIATLISSPGLLEPLLVENLRKAWGGGDATWLAGDEAAEFSLSSMPQNQAQIWRDLQNIRVDLVVQPAINRRKKLLLADMDSTMIQQECIDELADEVGVGSEVKKITARAMNGELDFTKALHERIALLGGQPVEIIDKVLAERIDLMPGAKTLVATMQKNGAYAALISGGVTPFTSVVARKLGFNEYRANELLIKDGVLTGKLASPILDTQAKVVALDEITATLNLTDREVLAVGDGANDLGMLSRAGTGVALHAKPNIAAKCTVQVNFGDLRALLYMQGYTEDTAKS